MQSTANPGEKPEYEEDLIDSILEKLKDFTGVDFTQYRRSTVHRRLQRRLAATNCPRQSDYLKLLETDPQEPQFLFRELTIKFSEFYRDPPLWDRLRESIFPEILREAEAAKKRVLRIWSAGVATGEEAYTAAMVFDDLLGRMKIDLQVSITATDIDEIALKQARDGEYSSVSMSKLPNYYLERYFTVGKTYRIIPRLKEYVEFKQDNLLETVSEDKPIKKYDIIFCRNVLIYLTKPLQTKLYENLDNALSPGGLLILGTAELLPRQYENDYRELVREFRVFKKER